MIGRNIEEATTKNQLWQKTGVEGSSKCMQQSGERGLVAAFTQIQPRNIDVPKIYIVRQSSWDTYKDSVIEIKPSKILSYNLLRKYIKTAILQTEVKQLNDGTWYAELPGFPGVSANDEISAEKARKILAEVLEDWLLLKMEDEDKDIPIIGQIDLNEL